MTFIRILVLVVLVNAHHLQRKVQIFKKYEQMCRNVTEDPYFEDEMVIGHVWRIYYAWNMIMGDQCMDITFKKVTNLTILNFRESMHSYVKDMPEWSNATLVMTVDKSREMLLIPDDDFPKIGRYVGVPNVHKGDYLGATRGNVDLYKMAVKLFYEGRYLLIGDCLNGVVSFLVRRDQKHTWGEITTLVTTFDVKFSDEGYSACKFNKRNKPRRHPNYRD